MKLKNDGKNGIIYSFLCVVVVWKEIVVTKNNIHNCFFLLNVQKIVGFVNFNDHAVRDNQICTNQVNFCGVIQTGA